MKTMLIGANSGISREIATLLASQREPLVLVGRDAEELQRMASDLMVRYDAKVQLGLFDAKAAPSSGMQRVFAECSRVIIAVGLIGDEEKARLDSRHAKEIERANFTGIVPIVDMAADIFERRGNGSIVVLSSIAADRARRGNRAYAAAKASLNRVIDEVASTHPHVDFTIVKLGPVDTEMTFGLHAPMTISPRAAAMGILNAMSDGKRVAYVPWRWGPVMAVVKRLPQQVVDKWS
jgi:decaprenylphospho-beta-D-erythro-pentofuranosid-2-ulose 2-reductase